MIQVLSRERSATQTFDAAAKGQFSVLHLGQLGVRINNRDLAGKFGQKNALTKRAK